MSGKEIYGKISLGGRTRDETNSKLWITWILADLCFLAHDSVLTPEKLKPRMLGACILKQSTRPPESLNWTSIQDLAHLCRLKYTFCVCEPEESLPDQYFECWKCPISALRILENEWEMGSPAIESGVPDGGRSGAQINKARPTSATSRVLIGTSVSRSLSIHFWE